MLQAASTDTKKATARGNSQQPAAREHLLSPPVSMLGNQAALRLRRKCDCGGGPDCDCDMGNDKKKKEKESPKTALHRAAASPSAPESVPPIVGETLRSPGQTLDSETRAFFESRFAHDFRDVRIHNDARAAQSAKAVNALAYTVGRDIAFASGRFAPSTPDGRRLLAHELTHVVQQPGSSAGNLPASDLTIGPPGDTHEREADRAADAIGREGNAVPHRASERAAGPPQVVSRSTSSPRHLHRQPAAAPAAAPASPPPTPAPLPATVPSPGSADFEIDRVATSTQSQIFFAKNSSTLGTEANIQVLLLKDASPGTVALIGHTSSDEAPPIAEARAKEVEKQLKAPPDPVNVSSATGNAAATENRSDFSHARSVDIVPAGGVSNTLDCTKTDTAGNLVNPAKKACNLMDPETWTAFNSACPIAEDATKKATDAVATTPTVDDASLIDAFFGNHDPATLATLKTNLGNLATHVGSLKSHTSCGGQCDVGGCAEGPIAYNQGVGPASPMTLCVPTFKGIPPNDQARNLIHESAHGTSPLGGSVGTGTQDVAYRHERMIIDPSLSPADKLRNSDTYALFAMRVREVRKTGNPNATPAGIKKPESDKFNGLSGPDKTTAETAVAQLEKRLTWSLTDLGQLFGSVVKLRGAAPAGPGVDPWDAFFGEPVMTEAAKGFPLTSPPAVPSMTDQTRLAGIIERYQRMSATVKRDLTLTKGATGTVRWAGAPAPAAPAAPASASAAPAGSAAPAAAPAAPASPLPWFASPSLEVGPDFFRATPEDQISLLLEQLAAATRDVETAFIPAYVALAKWIHQQNP